LGDLDVNVNIIKTDLKERCCLKFELQLTGSEESSVAAFVDTVMNLQFP